MFQLEGIDHVALAVRDVERSARWYQDVLGLSRIHREVWGSFPAVVGVGTTALALFPVASDRPDGPPGRETICVRHVAFRVDRRNFERAQAELRARGIELEFQDHQIAHSIYLRDPDGHQLEITTYEV
jgi:catechol 2,3-dioxygenase-like lactoylglutathione lyase family enzyme